MSTDNDECTCVDCIGNEQDAVDGLACQCIDREPQQVKPQFVLTDAEQADLKRFLWPQWINPNEFPSLMGLLHRLDKA